MNQSTQRSDRSLRVATLSKGNAPEPKGAFSRAVLTKVITDYIYAYLETSVNLNQPAPTLMFVLHDMTMANPHPVVVPFSLETYDIETLEGFIVLLIEQYPPDQYGMNMALYARFDPEYRAKGEFNVLFGARDSWGSSLHTSYVYRRYKDYDEMTHKPINNKYFDTWIQRAKFNDDFLNTAVSHYHTMVSMKAIKTYAN